MKRAVQIRLMCDDPRAVEAATKLLQAALPDHFTLTGTAPMRGPGQRAYGLLLVELSDPRDQPAQQGDHER